MLCMSWSMKVTSKSINSRWGPDHPGVVAPDRQPEGADQGSLLPGGQAQDEGAPGAAALNRWPHPAPVPRLEL